MNKTININCNFCLILTAVFLTLKLVGIINWAWVWVFAPLWVPIVAVLVIWLFSLIAMLVSSLLIDWWG